MCVCVCCYSVLVGGDNGIMSNLTLRNLSGLLGNFYPSLECVLLVDFIYCSTLAILLSGEPVGSRKYGTVCLVVYHTSRKHAFGRGQDKGINPGPLTNREQKVHQS